MSPASLDRRPVPPRQPAPRSRRAQAADRTRLVLVVCALVTFALYRFPEGRYLAYPLMLLSTLAHELGHGFAALLVGGSFERFEMWADGSGVATWGGSGSRLELAFVAAGGLVGPAFVAALAFTAGRRPKGARRALLFSAFLLGVALLFVVRNLFGFVFVSMLLGFCLLVGLKASDDIAQLALVFLALQLALSVFSRGDYLFTPTAQTAAGPMPSDVGQMALALLLPYWFWGGLCGLFSVAVLAFGLWVYWRS
jgi:hypothetical protein